MPEQRFDADCVPRRLPLVRDGQALALRPDTRSASWEEELKSSCNLGYAKACSRLPAERHADAVRFALGEERDGILRVRFVCERAYLPAGTVNCCMRREVRRGF